jgi:DNA (cytosine-5)-methyltransferase 1
MYTVNECLAMKKGLITVKEASELFGVSIQTIRRWDKKGKLKAVRNPMNNYRVYRLIEIRKLLKKMP